MHPPTHTHTKDENTKANFGMFLIVGKSQQHIVRES